MNELYFAAGRNALYAEQGRASARDYAVGDARIVREVYGTDGSFQRIVRRRESGKHFMDQAVLGYTSWRDPPENSLKHHHADRAGRAARRRARRRSGRFERAAVVQRGDVARRSTALNRQTQLHRGLQSRAHVRSSFRPRAPMRLWIKLSAAAWQTSDPINASRVDIDWAQVPVGRQSLVVITVAGAGGAKCAWQ